MIIVTGAKRSGTSLMMQMMKEAGFIILGDKFPKAYKNELNVKNKQGFYESKFIDDGANNTNCPFNWAQQKLSAIKIFCHGIDKTDSAYIGKVILMIRDWREQEESWKQLKKVSDGEPPKYPIGYDYFYEYVTFLNDYDKRKYPILMIDYNSLIKDSKKLCESLKNFLGIGRWDLAPKVINKKLYTVKSDKIKLEPSKFYTFMDEFYNNFKTGFISKDFRAKINEWKDVIFNDIQKINEEKVNG